MKCKTARFKRKFGVLLSNSRAQVAEMVLAPGTSEGDPTNRHKGADQWLYVVHGKGTAFVNRRKVALRAGSLLLIEEGDRHEIKNTGRAQLKTLNFYTPRAYTSGGNELPAARPA